MARLLTFRPGYIYSVQPRDEPSFSYRVMRALYPALGRIYPNIGITSEQLAQAMIRAAFDGSSEPDVIYENRDIRRLAGVA